MVIRNLITSVVLQNKGKLGCVTPCVVLFLLWTLKALWHNGMLGVFVCICVCVCVCVCCLQISYTHQLVEQIELFITIFLLRMAGYVPLVMILIPRSCYY